MAKETFIRSRYLLAVIILSTTALSVAAQAQESTGRYLPGGAQIYNAVHIIEPGSQDQVFNRQFALITSSTPLIDADLSNEMINTSIKDVQANMRGYERYWTITVPAENIKWKELSRRDSLRDDFEEKSLIKMTPTKLKYRDDKFDFGSSFDRLLR